MQKWWLFASEWWPTGSSDGRSDHHEPLWAEHWLPYLENRDIPRVGIV